MKILVTGAASGLGAALTRAWRLRGDDVLTTDLAGHDVDLELDITSDDDWATAFEEVQTRWGGLDILVNNAGVAGGGRLDVATLDEWRWITEINLFGAVRGTRTFVPLFKRQRSGHIVNVASLAGLVHGPGMASYNATKAGVVAISETLSFELGPWGIDVSVVCPAFFRTNLHRSFAGKDAAMQEAGVRLITEAKVDAGHIAAIVLEGIDARKKVILTERLGRQAYFLKRFARPIYDRMLTGQAARLARRGGVEPDDFVP
jgi:NAD(P)-dependent dehydrogenase (short-subunit alcohol dehydrogenase family)